MSLYNDIQLHANPNSGEVALFRALKTAMSGIGYVNELHGTKYQVDFDNPLNPSKIVTCELCDLLVFVYRGTEARFTFLQNKKKFSPKYKGNDKISLPLRQRYLLGEFPQIVMKNKLLHIPKDLLNNRVLDSIGSLGVFYLDNSGKINMDYSIMSLMCTTSSYIFSDYDRNRTRTFSLSGTVNLIRTINFFQEVEACSDLTNFESYLLNMKIGEPITTSNKFESEYVLASIESILENDSKVNNKEIIGDLQNIRKEYGIQKNETRNYGLPAFHVAIINAEKLQ